MIPEIEARERADEDRRVVLAYLKSIMEPKGVPWVRCHFSPTEGITGGIRVVTDKNFFSDRCWNSDFHIRLHKLPMIYLGLRFGPIFTGNVSAPSFEEEFIEWMEAIRSFEVPKI